MVKKEKSMASCTLVVIWGARLHQSLDLNGKPAPKEVNGLLSSLAIACASACVIPTCKIQKYKKDKQKYRGQNFKNGNPTKKEPVSSTQLISGCMCKLL